MVKNSSDKRYKDRNEQMSRGPECGLCTYQEALLLGTSPSSTLQGGVQSTALHPQGAPAVGTTTPSLCVAGFPRLSWEEGE